MCVPRGCVLQDDPGSHVVFTKQGSPTSHMTAAKVLDVISKLLGCVFVFFSRNIAHEPIPSAQAMKILDAPAAVDK